MAKFELEVRREMDTHVCPQCDMEFGIVLVQRPSKKHEEENRIASPRGSIGPKALFLHIVHFAGIGVRTNLLYSCYYSCIIASLAGNATGGS